jgi:HlyD family secretion protein
MRRSWLILIVIVVVVAALVGWSAIRPQARLEVVHPEVGPIRAYVEERAITELPHDYLISMPIAGWLERIELREGDPVEQGQVVAQLEKHDLLDRVSQAEQRIAVLETQLEETADHRLEENALVETEATVKAIDETVKAAEAKLEASEATLDFTESEVQRLRKLLESGAASERELREAEMEFRRARAAHQGDRLELAALKTIAAVSYIGPKFIRDYIDRKSFTLEKTRKELIETRAALEIEKRNLARAEITSPVDGVLLQRLQTRRQFMPAGTPLLTIGRLEDMEITAEVLTEHATRISPGDPAEIFGQGLPDGPLTGSVLRVYPAGFRKISSLGVEQQRVKVAIKPDRLPPGLGVEFRVHVRIFHDEVADALTLPRTCLFRGEDGGWEVMLVKDDRTELRAVQLGLMNDDRAQVTGGLTVDDAVIARPSREITAGMRVEIVGRD